MTNELAERHSLAAAVLTPLNAAGWNIDYIREGFKGEGIILPPTVSLFFLPSNFHEKELGHLTSQRSLIRRIQFDVYMETEDRAIAIRDAIGDILDGIYINIVDPLNSNVIGTLYVPDSETIRLDTMPPILTDPKVKRWRGIVQAAIQTDYL